ncbi:hypothetical protein [Lederbergia galactosidilytica]|uniref:Uncharacterized protein n=1 Tax=Lederbergia galactosidilytica TaxID=217031 RepID=A0A0Q9XR88_9BACI|nr:hypothetical protein [Lederbergia galactosidilytica]KRG10864.1 hypothetical protein ACA29_19540 [Lederbergia galactosidilytica]KRG15953.1 hypothetical protein ACA30_03480 [Virgibacillus soli]MBP1915675.1 hypothetical protein [Lederbergia galactosidilytica]OAK67732.1 hypothetical protein ABB05_18700 [Lederbergia galactosidilytica]
MIFRVILFLTGFCLAVSGGVSLIGYLNLMTMGNSWIDYISFVVKRPESYLLPLGVFLITSAFLNTVRKMDDSFPKE